MTGFLRVEDLEVYQKLCQLHLERRLEQNLPESDRRFPPTPGPDAAGQAYPIPRSGCRPTLNPEP